MSIGPKIVTSDKFVVYIIHLLNKGMIIQTGV